MAVTPPVLGCATKGRLQDRLTGKILVEIVGDGDVSKTKGPLECGPLNSIFASLSIHHQNVTADEPELMALAEDLRFLKDPAKGEHRLESGYVLVVD